VGRAVGKHPFAKGQELSGLQVSPQTRRRTSARHTHTLCPAPSLEDVRTPPCAPRLQGKALRSLQLECPSREQIMAVIPNHCFVKSSARSLAHAACSVAITAACVVAAHKLLPCETTGAPYSPRTHHAPTDPRKCRVDRSVWESLPCTARRVHQPHDSARTR